MRLDNAFVLVDIDTGIQVYTIESRLCMLNNKVKVDFLSSMNRNIEMQMYMNPMTMILSTALSNYRNTIDQRFPDSANTNNLCSHRIRIPFILVVVEEEVVEAVGIVVRSGVHLGLLTTSGK